MNILVAIKEIKEIEPLSNIGATEFYCGVKRSNTSSLVFNINRRCRDDLIFKCNFVSYDELKEALEIVHSLDKKIFLTLNENYTKEQFKQVLKELDQISKINLDGLIVTDLNLILELKKNYSNIPIHVSMLSAIFNSEAVKFYKELGASRIIFPRLIFADELKSIRKNCKNIELETFIDFFIGCPNVEGFCSSIHHLNPLIPTLCSKEYLYRINSEYEIPPEIESTCRICNIYDYLNIGIDSLKLTGREYPFEFVYISSYMIKKFLDIAKKCESKKTFVKLVYNNMDKVIKNGIKELNSISSFKIEKENIFKFKQILKSSILCRSGNIDLCYFKNEVI